MGELPTDLSTLLEAVEVMMGPAFADRLDDAIARFQGVGWAAGCDTGYGLGHRPRRRRFR